MLPFYLGVCLATFLTGIPTGAEDVKIPEFLQLCSRDSPDIDDCLAESIQTSLPKMAVASPELDMPGLDPYFQDDLKVEYNHNQIIAKTTMKDVYTYGLSSAKIHDVRSKIEDDKFELEVDVTSERVYVEGDYKAEGRYNALHIKGKGRFNCTMTDLKYTWKLSGEPEMRDGRAYIRITHFYMRPDVGDMHVYASHIFGDNQELNTVALSVANQYWRFIYAELLPYAQENWNKIGIEVANKLFQKVPYDQLFPRTP